MEKKSDLMIRPARLQRPNPFLPSHSGGMMHSACSNAFDTNIEKRNSLWQRKIPEI